MYKAELIAKAKNVEILILDIDGVFTDGRLIYQENGETAKQFNVLDGQGIKMLQQIGLDIAIISGRSGKHVERRCADLGINHVFLGVQRKLDVADSLLNKLGIAWTKVSSMGDDWIDLEVLQSSGLSCAPQNAHHEVHKRVNYVSPLRGGEGAVRDVCDLLLVGKGEYAKILKAMTPVKQK